ncbi:MAG: hypothetical protein LBU32_12185 [Clostridiales bacterium]|nr:hypothetical protein [Clostridiales bacterium]
MQAGKIYDSPEPSACNATALASGTRGLHVRQVSKRNCAAGPSAGGLIEREAPRFKRQRRLGGWSMPTPSQTHRFLCWIVH